MLPFEISQIQTARDQDLARMVKDQQSNEAITEITNRYTGFYLSVINGLNLPPMIRSDLIDQKNTNMYSYTVGYKEDKGMKLSSFIHQSAYYECLKALHSDTAKHNEQEIAYWTPFGSLRVNFCAQTEIRLEWFRSQNGK